MSKLLRLASPALHAYPLHLVGWIVWFLTLWYLSSGELPLKTGPKIPFSDKIMHWGYFGIGGAFTTFYTLGRTNTRQLTRPVAIALLLLGVFVGAIDEWHQCWNMNRSGKDLGDLTADTVGTLSGILVAQWVWAQARSIHKPARHNNTLPTST